MDVRCPFFQNVATVLIGVLFLNPIVATAAELTIDAAAGGNAQLGQAGNGVPIVNIATPNASGLSHNKFRDYNVDAQGLILNNATSRTQSTQLGGIIVGNPNLTGGAAGLILNEVTGSNPTQLRGYTEVAGQSAHVIVANPYGVTCNGCGFINTPHATLTTGKPVIDNGRLSSFDVNGGAIAIEGAGLNASNIDQFDLITRSAKLNADIYANRLNVITGRNQVDAATLATTAKSDDGSAEPQLAIDSSALGGMYAGAIRLVGTEAGVGVKLAGNMAASAGDIQIDANGHLSISQVASSEAIAIKAASIDAQGPVYAGTTLDAHASGAFSTQKSLAARDRVNLSSGGQLSNSGIIEAGVNTDNRRNAQGDVDLSALNLRNTGSVIASRNLSTQVTQTLDNRGGKLSAQNRTKISAATLDNRQQGHVLSNDSIDVSAERVINNQGLINSLGSLNAQVGDLNNSGGELSSHGAVSLNVAALDNSAGLVMAGGNLGLSSNGAVNNRNGRLGANQAVSLSGTALDNRQNGLVSAASTLDLDVTHIENQGGLVTGGTTRLTADTVENSEGRISSKADLVATIGSLNQRNGEFVAQGNLSLTGTSLNNYNGGLVGAAKALKVQVNTVDNRGGEISSSQEINVSGQHLNNSDGGKVLAGTNLELTVAHVINQAQGLLNGQGRTTVTGQTLDNSGGTLSALSAVSIRLDGVLSNVSGLINSEGTLTASAGSLNNRQGSLSSAGSLNVTSSGAIDNQGGELLSDAGVGLQSVSLNNQQLGNISGKGAVRVNTGALDNSQGGRLTSSDTLDISAAQVNNQDSGRIASDKALTANVTGLDQRNGLLFSNHSLNLNLNHGQLNNQNGLITAPLLVLSNLNGVNNQGGEISSDQAFTVGANNLDNDNGKLLSNQALTLRLNQVLNNLKGLIAAAVLDVRAGSLNNQGGTLTSRGHLLLAVGGLLDNQNQGLINATGRLSTTSAALHNQNGGSLLGGSIALDFDPSGGDLNNAGGLITTAGPLSITRLRDLNNTNGEISSSQSFTLAGRTLENHSGKLISSQQLTLQGTNVSNQNGLISGWEGLVVNAHSLDNRNTGTLSSRNGDLTADVEDTLLNNGAGALVSKKSLTVKAANLDNSNGGILSSAGSQALTVDATLNNSQGGQIDSGTSLTVQTATLNNHGGSISAAQAISVTGTTLDNTSGNLSGNAAVSLTLLGTLTNISGKLASAGPLRLSASQVDNQGGQLASQGLLTLLTGGLNNRSRGTVVANNLLTLTATGVVQNGSDGLIYSQHGDLSIRASGLDNAQGTLQSKGLLSLDVVGDIDNQNGHLIAQDGDLNLTAVNLNNQGGVWASLHATLTAALSGWLKNGLGGITQAEKLNLTAQEGIDNQAGRIAAQTGDLIVDTAHFDNRSGGLYAAQRINVSSNELDNRAGQIAGQDVDLSLAGSLSNSLGIIESDRTLSISAASLDNQSGQLRALGTSGITRFQIGGVLNNHNGILESANTDLSLGMGGFLNTGGSVLHVGNGTFDIATANVINAGGDLLTRGGLTLNAASWTNSSVIQAGRLTVNVNDFTQTTSGQLLAATSLVGNGVNWNNDGLIASDGSLDVRVTGLYNGNGRLSSLGNLTVYANQLYLPEVASIASGGDSLITVGGQLTNLGRLTSTSGLTLNAGNLNNYGTLGSGQNLTLKTSALLNDHGLIFSGQSMSLQADSLTNSYASIYSLGNLAIDRDGHGGLASSLINSSGLIQSDGSMSLAASTIHNIRALLNISHGGIYTAKIEQIQCIEGVNAGDCSGKRNRVWEIVQRDKLEVTAASAASSITAGGNLAINGGDLLNQSSTIATSGNFTATLNNLTNTGVEASDTETVRVFRTQRASDGSGWTDLAQDFTSRYWFQSSSYDANNLGGLAADMSNFIGTTEAELPQFGRVTQLSTGDQSYAAIIQAAGNVNITTQNNFDNSVVRSDFEYVGSGPSTNTKAPGKEFSTRITLNQQLPPNLAQQQVNPLALPGFELPTGQNGLFRLSGLGGTQGDTGPQSWSVGDASVGREQRQQTVPGTSGRVIDTSGPGSLGMAGSVSIDKVQGLPSSSGKSNPHKYLIETNPALTDLKQFMSSDYLLGLLGVDPDNTQKRLGDGLYEQRLIQQAIVARTGQRFIAGMNSDEAMFRYLMDNAIASKDVLHLSLGVSLSAEQVAALTHDIVWMETVVVNGQEVMVPVLYLAQSNNRLAANGALIQGQDMTLIAGNNLSNSGTLKASSNLSAIAGKDLLNSGLVQAGNRLDLLASNDLTNKAGGVIAGRDVSLTSLTGDVINERTVTGYGSSNGYNTQHRDFVDNAARIEAANDLSIQAGRDVSNIGGVLQSGRDTRISAGRDVTIGSATQVNSNSHGSNNRDLTIRQNGSSIDAGRDLSISTGRDLTLIASQVEAQRDIALAAGNNLTLASAADEEHSYSKSKKVTKQEDHVRQQSTEVKAGGDVYLSSGQDLTLLASKVEADKEAYLVAGNNLALLSAEDQDYSYYLKTKTSKSGLSSTNKTRMDSSRSTTQVGSLISADKITIRAAQDMTVQGSDVASTSSTSLLAGRNVLIDGATETFETSHAQSKKKSGLMSSGGIGVTIGSNSLKTTQDEHSEQTRSSTIGSVLGNVDIQAGKDLTIRGSDVIAGKDVSLIGESVNILASQNENRSEQTTKSKSSGLTLALSGSVGSAINTAYETTRQSRDEDDSRLTALQGVKAGLTGVQAWQAAQQSGGMSADNVGQFVGISISAGSQQSKSQQVQEQSVSQGSTLTAGNNLTILATGSGKDGEDGDIRIQGSQLKAGQDVTLAANRDLVLEAASNTQRLDGNNSSSGGNVGISLGAGPNGAGLSIFANGNKGSGFENGNGTTWTETTVDAGHQVTLISGRDTSLIGAQVSGEKIAAKVGRDLTLQSLQDTDEYDSKQKNVSGGASLTLGTMTGSAYVSVDQSKMHSNYDSVQEQTGLYAGKGGYDIEVGSHTQLDGAVIASTASADKNHLSSDTLGWNDIRNEADYKTQQQGVSVSTGGNKGSIFTGNMPGGIVTAYTNSDSESGTTHSAISAGTIEVRNGEAQQQDVTSLSRDVEHANGSISPIFDKEKEQRRLQEVQLIAQIGSQSMDILRTQGEINAEKKAREELSNKGNLNPSRTEIENSAIYQSEMERYGTGSDLQRAAQAVTAVLQGLTGGDIGSALAGASAPYLANAIKLQTEGNTGAQLMAHAVLGGLVAYAQGNSAIAGAAGAATAEGLAAYIAKQLYNKNTDELSEAEKQSVVSLASLAGGLAGGVLEGDSGGVVTGTKAGQNAVENNEFGGRLYVDRVFEAYIQSGGCEGASRQQCRKDFESAQLADGGLEAAATFALLPVAIAGVAATPAILAAARAAVVACKTNPILCVNETTILVGEMGVGEALPAGLVGTAGAKLTLEQATQVRIAMEVEKQMGQKLSADVLESILTGGGAKGGLPPLRQAYVHEVKVLEDFALNMRAAGASPEQVARQLHQMRRDLGIRYKDLTPAPQLEAIYTRNLEKYGDKLGPTVDWLRAKGKSWEQIIESASRSGGKDLGF